MRFLVTVTHAHGGKSLDVDATQEMISLYASKGNLLGTVSWQEVIDRILAGDEDTRFAHSRAHPRAPLAVKVRYATPDGKQFDSLTGGIGGGGGFLEGRTPPSTRAKELVVFFVPLPPPGKNNTPNTKTGGLLIHH